MRLKLILAGVALMSTLNLAGGAEVSIGGPLGPSGGIKVETVGVVGVTQIATSQISVGTTATQIVAARVGRANVIIVNHGTTNVSLGTSGVTTANGLLLLGTAGTAATIEGGAAVFGIVAAGSQTVSFMEQF